MFGKYSNIHQSFRIPSSLVSNCVVSIYRVRDAILGLGATCPSKQGHASAFSGIKTPFNNTLHGRKSRQGGKYHEDASETRALGKTAYC